MGLSAMIQLTGVIGMALTLLPIAPANATQHMLTVCFSGTGLLVLALAGLVAYSSQAGKCAGRHLLV
jgi:hypothetical protein